jgi:polyisoprenoid-binding protein YceI
MSEEPVRRWRTVDGRSLPIPGAYDVDPVHSFVMFRVRHLVVGRVDGRLTSFQGQFTVTEDPARLFDRLEVTFEPASVDTHVKMRDDDLRSPRFLDTDHFPTIVLTGGTSSRVADHEWTVDAERSRPTSRRSSRKGRPDLPRRVKPAQC